MFESFPTERPATALLDAVDGGRPLSTLDERELLQLADEIRAYLLFSVGQSGGHFGAGLGVVELTIALHHVFNTPRDRLVWDVGHQSYPHKILTGRMQRMSSMRQAGGLSGFPKRSESEFDTFGVGHSSTSISAAMGMALAAAREEDPRRVVAIIGDGAITGGMAFEALAHAGEARPNMLVILNDNQMSIGHNTGGLATYFAKIWASKTVTTGFSVSNSAVRPLDWYCMELMMAVMEMAVPRTPNTAARRQSLGSRGQGRLTQSQPLSA